MGGGGPGMMGTMAAAVGGTMLGSAISHQMFGGRHHDEGQQDQQQMQPMAQQGMEQQGPCAQSYEAYTKCVEANQGNVNNCLWAWDMVAQCKNRNGLA